ncbi:hypothetical protein [Pseudomonas sp. Irchel s3f7]|uniref:hypothetical protein n=1 Tax=Pseudomonas sp. Irchel s3f7 TaxID=2009153 RepID=UPI000BA46AC5|nr:hypothetical protein [Pseudomonas sp. Irchel s3f7]
MQEDPRVTALDDHYYKGNLTFDQFVLGVALAACAYLAQTLKYGVIGWNEQTLQIIPLLILGIGAWLGFKRVESTITLISINARHLELCHANPKRSFPNLKEQMNKQSLRTGFFYRWRNRVIFLGLASHVGVKVLISYPIF